MKHIKKRFNLAHRHRSFDRQIFERLKQQTESDIFSISTPEARKIYSWNRQVAGCFQRSRAFVRLKISPHGIVYGRIEPEHYVEDMVARWFLSRFPLFMIMLESQRGTFVISKDNELTIHKEPLSELLHKYEETLPENPILKELQHFNDDEFWQKYYDSQLIKERTNRRYFQKNIPRKYHDWEGLRLEKARFGKNRSLKEFSLQHKEKA